MHWLTTCLLLISFTLTAQQTVIDSIFHDGIRRSFQVYLPAHYQPSNQPALVLNLHGLTSDATQQTVYSGFNGVADTANVIVCYPNAVNGAWNVFADTTDDVAFIDSLIGYLSLHYSFDPDRVFATGISNGGAMVYYLACFLSERFRAVAVVAGVNTIAGQLLCNPPKKMNVLHIHGTADFIIPYQGGLGILSVAETMEFWADHNSCDAIPDTVNLPDISTIDFCTAQRSTYTGCDDLSRLVLYTIVNGGHTWPGSTVTIGITNHDIHASVEIWRFFNQFGKEPTSSPARVKSSPLKVYSNPFKERLSVGFPDPYSGVIDVFAADGKLVYSSPFDHHTRLLEIPTTNWPPGIYLMRIRGEQHAVKLVKGGY